jgi:hypothetical protein
MAISGKTGVVQITGHDVICVTDWSVNDDIARIDVTSTCDVADGTLWTNLIAGKRTVTGSFTCYTYIGNAQSANVTFSNDDLTIYGNALINFAVKNPVEGAVEYTYDVAFYGVVSLGAGE